MDLDTLVRGVVEARRAKISEHRVRVEIEGHLHAPHCSRAVAKLVFETLLDNALSRCPVSGGRIRIGWLPSSQESRVFFLTDNGSTPTLDVIAEAEEAAATKAATLVVERAGGTLWQEVEPGSGTTFFVIFGPVDPDPKDGNEWSTPPSTFSPE